MCIRDSINAEYMEEEFYYPAKSSQKFQDELPIILGMTASPVQNILLDKVGNQKDPLKQLKQELQQLCLNLDSEFINFNSDNISKYLSQASLEWYPYHLDYNLQSHAISIQESRCNKNIPQMPVSYTHLRAHETRHDLVCRLLLEKKKKRHKSEHAPDQGTRRS
eukprot:TRINITY_DN9900_c0_g1_i1.p1 TRINITY_DN9900_c0_g1~~TRINITY_DN9900_c0_g1_i1.p1  ORF type:complete len:164 (+),score=27.85 TRINITY_DN9900_c0_g1_i1:138-629(+)